MKSGRLNLHLLLILTHTNFATSSPLFEKAYLQFTEVVCDNNKVGYFCDNTACFSDSDCFNGKCNMYARCAPRIVFDSLNNLRKEIARDKEDFNNNKLDTRNSTDSRNATSAAKNLTDSEALRQ